MEYEVPLSEELPMLDLELQHTTHNQYLQWLLKFIPHPQRTAITPIAFFLQTPTKNSGSVHGYEQKYNTKSLLRIHEIGVLFSRDKGIPTFVLCMKENFHQTTVNGTITEAVN
ncbi:hypothetical protein CEXT_73731 [Caerostris extrusa]|uniref:Uncharacterized protein n=1 Tax=Caerostris extrusa TaxID=172846 RepID=A0AAV4NYY0_CAEEX|nr:hypothetical protein CEXT_73731 [Caerostris extrusa]